MLFYGNAVKILDPWTADQCDAPIPTAAKAIERSVGGMVHGIPLVCGGLNRETDPFSFNKFCYFFSNGQWTSKVYGSYASKAHRIFASSIISPDDGSLRMIGGFDMYGPGRTCYTYYCIAKKLPVVKVDIKSGTVTATQDTMQAQYSETCSVLFANNK